MTIPGHGITQPSITNGKIFSISHITLLQLDGIIWEEDSIAYGCENATLVLNNQKGLLRKNYACLESGRYQTPDGKDTPWPVCTTKPTDPCEFTCIWSAHAKSLACEQTSLRLRVL